MDDFNKKDLIEQDKEIIFSKVIKAGKRIYYIDVKKSRNDDMFLAITESKKVNSGKENNQVSFEKHKIFLYREDFERFCDGLIQSMNYIDQKQPQHNIERFSFQNQNKIPYSIKKENDLDTVDIEF